MADEVRVACKVMSERVDGREVFIIVKTEYAAGSSTPGRTYVVGPQGQITDTYEEMLELLGVDPRARPRVAESDEQSLDDGSPVTEMSHEEVSRELAKDQQAINALGDFLDLKSGFKRRRPAVLPPPVESAAAATVKLDRAELERGFVDRFPSLPPTKREYPALDLSAAPPEDWVELERQRRRKRRGNPQDVAY